MSNLKMLQQWKGIKQRYYRNLNHLSFCRSVLLIGHFTSEHVAEAESDQKWYYRNLNTLSLCRPVLLSGNVQSEHVAEVESVQATILLES